MKEVVEFTDKISYSVDKIKDLCQRCTDYQVLVGWKGYSSSRDTWEPFSIINKDVLSKIQEFFKSKRSNSLIKKAKTSSSLELAVGDCYADTTLYCYLQYSYTACI